MDTERRSRSRIVLVLVLVLVIEPRHPIEDENEDDEEKFARRAKILRDSSTNEHKSNPIPSRYFPSDARTVFPNLFWQGSSILFVWIRVHSWSLDNEALAYSR